MNPISSFSDIVDLWPRPADFGRAANIPASIAANIKSRNSADVKYFDGIVQAAEKIGRKDITHKMLCRLAAAQRKPPREVVHG